MKLGLSLAIKKYFYIITDVENEQTVNHIKLQELGRAISINFTTIPWGGNVQTMLCAVYEVGCAAYAVGFTAYLLQCKDKAKSVQQC